MLLQWKHYQRRSQFRPHQFLLFKKLQLPWNPRSMKWKKCMIFWKMFWATITLWISNLQFQRTSNKNKLLLISALRTLTALRPLFKYLQLQLPPLHPLMPLSSPRCSSFLQTSNCTSQLLEPITRDQTLITTMCLLTRWISSSQPSTMPTSAGKQMSANCRSTTSNMVTIAIKKFNLPRQRARFLDRAMIFKHLTRLLLHSRRSIPALMIFQTLSCQIASIGDL